MRFLDNNKSRMNFKVTITVLFSCLLLTVSSQLCNAQNVKSFSVAQDDFIKELGDYMSNIENKEEKNKCKIAADDFIKDWNGGIFSDSVKRQLIKSSNIMLKHKMKVVPHFYAFLNTVVNIASSPQSTTDSRLLTNFLNSVNYIINNGQAKHFTSYLENIDAVIKNNILQQTNTTLWKTSKVFDKFVFDTVPRFIFRDIDLKCYANKDSSVINNTFGIFYPLTEKWKGMKGKINWKRAGLSEDSVYAMFAHYAIDLKHNKYTADSVTFYDKYFFSKPMIGSVEEKILYEVNEEKASYPRFDSYDKRIVLKNIFKDIDYNGGFSLYGSKLLGKGDKHQDAELTFIRHKKRNITTKQQTAGSESYATDSIYKFINCKSKIFLIYKDRIASEQASITIYYQGDSIYHPGLRMKYIKQNRELSLLRYEEGQAQSPYFDTYHKVDMYFEALTWKMDENKVDLAMIKGPGLTSEAKFQSFNFFTIDKYLKIQGIDEVNPLEEIRAYSVKNKTREFFIDEYASFIKKSPNSAKALLLTLSNMGFLIYNLETDKITIKERLFYYLAAKHKRTDYDVIEFNSLVTGQKSNATLEIDNFNLTVRGVNIVSLSDSQRVYIFPDNRELVLKKNRDFNFNGRVHAGMFDFYGKQFAFDYDKFKLNLPKVDSLTFMVKSFDKNTEGKRHLVKVKSVIEDISGDLAVDNPKNKSGLMHYPGFPILNSKKESFVYYNKKYIQKGVYSKEKFFYKIYPFTIDSLANFKTERMMFAGILNSAGIFPDIEEPLKVQPDYSLGFTKNTTDAGYPAYAGKGTFYNNVDLSNKGLRGDGSLSYLASTTKSNEFIFFPDSMNTLAQNYELKEQTSNTEYPYVTGEDVKIHWMPYKDLMRVSSLQKTIAMYKDQTNLIGMLYLSPSGLRGRGKMDFHDAEIESRVYRYKNMTFDADTADFSMKAFGNKEISFITHNYKARVDFNSRKGDFISNGGGSKVEFPVNQYICFMDEFEWYMDTQELSLSDSKNRSEKYDNLSKKELIEIDLTGSKFISVNPTQDSLQFFSPKAKYNLKDNIIFAQGVKIIKVADAAIFPDKGDVTVLKKAEMKPLEHSTVIANTTTEYHNIYDATVNILSRKKYIGAGKYDYIDESEKKQQLYLDKIGVDSTLQSYGKGYIAPEIKFKLSDAFDYVGEFKLLASKEFLTFNGAVRIKQSCDSLSEWLKFKLEINPKEIYIPVASRPEDYHKRPIFAAFFLSEDTSGVYSRFLYKRSSDKDSTLLSAKGFLYFDKQSNEYRISTKEKLKTLTLPGQYLSLNNTKCITKAEGKIKFGTDLGRVEFNAYGNAKHYIIPDSTNFDLTISADFFFNDKSIELMTNSIKQNTKLKPTETTNPKYTKALYEILGVKEADKLISDLSLGMGLKKMPSEIKKTLFITDVKMKWVPELKAFASKGKIGIGNIYSTQINKYVDGYIVLKKRKNSDELTIYLQPSESEWFIFDYDSRRKLMSGYSSNKEFNLAVTNTKPDNRKLKSKGGEESYSYYITSDRRRNEFLEMIQSVKY